MTQNRFGWWVQYYKATVVRWTHPETKQTFRRLVVEKRSGKDKIPWDVLQEIKNDLLGHEVVCVEVYPAEPNLVNEYNLRHLWEVPEDFLPFGLHRLCAASYDAAPMTPEL
jgi:hypothetical protein